MAEIKLADLNNNDTTTASFKLFDPKPPARPPRSSSPVPHKNGLVDSWLANASKPPHKSRRPKHAQLVVAVHNVDHGDHSSYRLSRNSSATSCISDRSNHSSAAASSRSQFSSCRSVTPRRTFPQNYSDESSMSLTELKSLDPASTVFDGRLSFVIGCDRQRVRQQMQPRPAYTSPQMASSYLSSKIDSFLKRTDHVAEEWQNLGRGGGGSGESVAERNAYRSKSAANIRIKGFQMTSSMPPTQRLHGGSRASLDLDDDCTITEGLEEVNFRSFCVFVWDYTFISLINGGK